jgi:hypothetical protein
MRSLAAVALTLVLTALAAAPAAVAQEATPAPLGSEACTVDPIDPETYNGAILASVPPLFYGTESPEGEPADEETTAAVTDAVRQSIACTNIGDLGRLLAVIDPAYAPTLLGVPYGEVPEAIEAAAAASRSTDPATPLVDDIDEGALDSSLVSVGDALLLADGRVAVLVTIQREGFPAADVTIYLTDHPTLGRWVISEYVFTT